MPPPALKWPQNYPVITEHYLLFLTAVSEAVANTATLTEGPCVPEKGTGFLPRSHSTLHSRHCLTSKLNLAVNGSSSPMESMVSSSLSVWESGGFWSRTELKAREVQVPTPAPPTVTPWGSARCCLSQAWEEWYRGWERHPDGHRETEKGLYPLAHRKCPSKGPERVETTGLELPLEKLSSHSHGVKGKNHPRTQSCQPSLCPVVMGPLECRREGLMWGLGGCGQLSIEDHRY